MQLNEILKELNSIIDSGRKVPGFNGKMMIDSEKLSEIFRELSNSADAGLNEAQLIITQKESILEQAQLEANRIKDQAENSALEIQETANLTRNERLSDSNIIKEAEETAEKIVQKSHEDAQNIIQDAQRQAFNLISESESRSSDQRDGADRYSREVLSNLEERLSDVLGQVRRGLDTLGSDQNMTGDRSNGNHTIVS